MKIIRTVLCRCTHLHLHEQFLQVNYGLFVCGLGLGLVFYVCFLHILIKPVCLSSGQYSVLPLPTTQQRPCVFGSARPFSNC